MGKGRIFSKLAVLVAVLGLAFAATAVAYTLPKPPGSPGGPPTPPTGGSGGTKTGATALGTKIAAFTSGELAKHGTFTITVHFPSGGTILGSIIAAKRGVGVIGQGFAGRANKGTEPLGVSFSAKGKKFLNANNGKAIKLIVKLTFVPNARHKKTQTSTVTVTTFN